MEFKYNPDAEYILESNKGVKHNEAILKEKKTVFSWAQLQRIPHDHSENDSFALKIGRYKSKDGKVDKEKPKSELTLDDEEFSALMSFIDTNYSPMKKGVDTFIPVGDSQLLDLVKRMKNASTNGHDIVQALLDGGLLDSNVSSIIEHKKRIDALNSFKENINNPGLLESHWQEWFKNNKWVLGSEYAKILDERQIDTDNIADYLMKSNDGFVDVIEIKKPNGLKVWAASLDHGNLVPSSDLVAAITQCQNYLFEIEREMNSIKFSERVENLPIANPRCMLVFGRSNDWTEGQQLAFRLLNSSLNRITIVTYDQLYQRASNTVGLKADLEDKN